MVVLKRGLRQGAIIIFLSLLAFLSGDTPLRQPIVIVALGDSVTYGAKVETGYVEMIRQAAPDLDIINAGKPNEKSWEAIQRLDEIKALEPYLVIIYYGTTDVKEIHRGNKTWQDFLTSVGKLAQAFPRVILATPHRGRTAPDYSYHLEDVNHAAKLIREMGYPVADVNAICCGPDQMCDYGHPNEEGHEVIAQAILEALAVYYPGLDK